MRITPKEAKINSFLVTVVFLISGITLFVVSVFFGSQIISLIGLGLIFWGVIFLLIPPPKNVEASFLITSSLPDYMTIDRMLNYLTPKNEAYNIPPCPKDIHLPQQLEGLKEMVTFIPAEQADGIAEIEDIARSKFLIEKPNGLLIASPGVGLLEKIEQRRNIDFARLPLSELDQTLPYLFGQLNLSKEIEMTANGNDRVLQITGSYYQNMYSQKYALKSINLLGCPLVNAAACAISKSAGKPTMIQKIENTPNGKKTSATIKIIERTFEKRQKLIDDIGKVSLRADELLRVIDGSMGIIDLSFDILAAFNEKRINWQRIEDKAEDFGEVYSFAGQTMPSLNLGFIRVSSATKKHLLSETIEEVRAILKVIYYYFDGLNLDEDIKGSIPNFLSVKAIILSYFTFNDLLLGKVVGDKENPKEKHQLESVLQILANMDFKVNTDELMANINKIASESDLERVIYDSREIFKEQLRLLNLL